MSDVDEEIIALISEQIGVPESQINTDSVINGKLGVDGDDAYDLLLAYQKKFSVDLSNFTFRDHFGSEGVPFSFTVVILTLGLAFGYWQWGAIPFAIVILSGYFNAIQEWLHPTGPLYVRDLIEAARSGRLCSTPSASVRCGYP
jgi:acyl carrier protein